MAKYDRLFFILNLLRSRRGLNARRLAEECQVTERSIYRDIISLSEANVPIYYDRGYKLATGNFLPALNFTFEEYSCLKLALESSPLQTGGWKSGVLSRVKAKIDSGLTQAVRERLKTSVDSARIEVTAARPSRSVARYYAIIETAVTDQTCLVLDYGTIEHGLTKRTVEPYFIIFRGRAFYFVAFCRLRNEFRTFRIDRVKSIKATEDRFVRKRGINAADYFADSWQLHSGPPVEVVVRFKGAAARVVSLGKHHPKEIVTEAGDGIVEYRLQVSGIEEIQRWIIGFGADAEVVAPESLRQKMAVLGGYLKKIYSTSSKKR